MTTFLVHWFCVLHEVLFDINNMVSDKYVLLSVYVRVCLSVSFPLSYHLHSPYDVSSYIIYVGRHQLNGWNPFEVSRRIRRVVIPPEYSDPQEGDDIALVQLDSEVKLDERIQPICLPGANTLFPSGMQCTTTGWGHIRDGGERGSGNKRSVTALGVKESVQKL